MELSTKNIWFYLLSIIVLGVGSFLIVENFHKEQVKIWDEASSAKNAIEMLAQKSFIVQYEDGKPVRDDFKPPLSLWLKMICYKVFGINEFSVRLPSIVAALFTMQLLWFYGAFVLKKPLLGILSALFLVLSKGYVYRHVTRTGDPDSLLIFFITCSIISFFELVRNYPAKSKQYYFLLGFSVLLAIYTKSIMGIAPLAGIFLYVIIVPKARKLLFDHKLYITFFSVLIVVSFYYIAREIVDPGYLKGVVKFEFSVINNYPLGNPKHPEFFFYFKYLFLKGFNPFFYLIPISIIFYFFINDELIKQLIVFSTLGALVFLFGMSISVTKNEWYISPIYPYLSILTASGIYALFQKANNYFNNRIKWTFFSIFFIVLILLSYNAFKSIHRTNNYYKNYVYNPEREGRFLDACKKNIPELFDIDIITKYYTRQIKFYASKYKYIDGTNVNIYKNIPNNIVGRKIISSNPVTLLQLFKTYKTNRIFNDEYCELIHIVEEKDSTKNRYFKCDLDSLSEDKNKCFDSFNKSVTYYINSVTTERNFNGTNSAIASEKSPFNLCLSFNPNSDQNIVHASVWHFKNNMGYLVINIPELNIFKKSSLVVSTKGEWEQIENILILPKDIQPKTLKVFVWNPNKEESYFDDLEIQIF